MQGIAGINESNIEFEIFDGDLMNQSSLLFDSNNQLHLTTNNYNPDFDKTSLIALQEHSWTLYFNTPESYVLAEANIPRYIVLAGTLVDLLLFYVIYSLYFINKRAEAIAYKMTQESKKANSSLRKTTVSRDYMNSILQSMLDLLIVVNPDNTIQAVNAATLNLLGYEEKELIGQSVEMIFDKEEGMTLFTAEGVEGLISDTKTYYQVLTYQTKDKRKIPMQFSGSVMLNTDGHLQGIICIAQDITESKWLEEELLKSRKLESVGLLAGGIAHDFNNILTGLFGNIELAKKKLPPDHAAHANIKNANQALEKATNLTKQLLTFSKGGDPLLEMIDIRQIIRDTIKLSLSGSNVKTTLVLPDDLWQVKADKGQLSQVITNLVINADQVMETGGSLTIEAENVKDVNIDSTPRLSGEVVKLTIADNGPGISEENQNKIFDPYFTTRQTGHGLGLTTVHSIISKHNGHIIADSELGVGTSFTIYLPADSSFPQVRDTISSNFIEKPRITAGHILVMDDDEMILSLSTEIIETFGYTVDTAVDGKEAIDKYISAKKCGKAFDLVIMDLTIPGGMGGKEAITELTALDPEVKVIVSSGYSTDPVMANYIEYGFKGRLAKPFQMDELEKELSLHIAQE